MLWLSYGMGLVAVVLFVCQSGYHISDAVLSLTALKVLIGIILLGKASQYRHVSKSSDNQTEQVPVSASSSSEAIYHRRKSDPTKAITEQIESGSQENTTRQGGNTKRRIPKTKSLSDVERFTLCSNRIV